jgi:hypothetical protein
VTPVYDDPAKDAWQAAVSPDGGRLYFLLGPQSSAADLFTIPIDSSGGPAKFAEEGPAMGEPVSVPLWLFLAIVVFALWALLDRLLIPSGRWFLRRRLNRLIDRVNRGLAVEIKPFQLTKRQVLIDRLVYDPQVVAAANEHARTANLPREVAMAAPRR